MRLYAHRHDTPRLGRNGIALAAVAALFAVVAFTPIGSVIAQPAPSTAHQYVVGVSGMH